MSLEFILQNEYMIQNYCIFNACYNFSEKNALQNHIIIDFYLDRNSSKPTNCQ